MNNYVGVDVGGTTISAALVTEKGNILNKTEVSTDSQKSKEKILKNLFGAIDYVKNDSVKGIGVGFPSPLKDRLKGSVWPPNIPALQNIFLKDILKKKFDLPIKISNDANCFAVGEKVFGKGKKYSDFVTITIGTGFGVGVIVNNKLFEGRNCAVGEIGNFKGWDMPHRKDSLDYYCGGARFLKDISGKTGKELFEEAKIGNKDSIKFFEKYGYYLGQGIAIVSTVYNPEAVIIGGNLRRAFDFFKKNMFSSIKENLRYKFIFDDLKIEISELENAGMIGAAALFLN